MPFLEIETAAVCERDQPQQLFQLLRCPRTNHAPLPIRIETHDLTLCARSYLHANCAQCHVAAGGGNAQMELEFGTALKDMKVIDELPLHDKFNIPDAKLLSPGHPDQSVLLHRIAIRGRGQMPQLATDIIEDRAVQLFRDWIAKMKPAEK